jgi:cell division initiation protein
MTLSAIDIEQKTFRVALRGYAEEEVDAFLDEIISTVRSLEQQVQESRDRIADLESQATESRDTEDRITRTLVIAQKTADEVVREARFEAQQILSQARLDASEIETEQTRKREQLGSEVQMLQSVVGELREHVKNLTERLMAQVIDTESAMDDLLPGDFQAEGSEEGEFEEVEESLDEEDAEDSAETGEVYLGSDRRPWERYGD